MIRIKSGRNILISIVLLTSILFTTYVYAAFNAQLTIEGEAIVRSNQDIRITNISIKEQSNGAYETYNNKYNKDVTFMYVTLPSNSSITYEVEITNKSNIDYYVSDIIEELKSNSNISYNISNINLNDVIPKSSSKIFTILITNMNSNEEKGTIIVKYNFNEKIYFNKYIQNIYMNGSSELSYDNTADNNLRYIGNSPNNYILFNDELWRIIGVMKKIKDENNNEYSLVKIVKDESLGLMMWNEVNDNTWSTSTLAKYLNNDYYNSIQNYDKTLINNVTWNISPAGIGGSTNALYYYNTERSNSTNERNIWNGYIGLIYPSDYAFATGGYNKNKCLNSYMYYSPTYNEGYITIDGCLENNWLYTGNETWFITPGADATRILFIYPEGFIDFGGKHTTPNVNLNVYPTLYLKHNTLYQSGNGSRINPYKIKD